MGLLLGAYLKKPNTEKISTDEVGRRVICGASSMQGWRITQEDAHNCSLDYDTNTSLFAVYDGHGGHEVAKYTAQHLPQYLKDCEAYKKGDYIEALKDAFLGFDATLTTPEVVEILKEIQSSIRKVVDEQSDTDVEEEENIKNLYEEAEMPLEQVIAKYKSDLLNSKEKSKREDSCSSKASSSGAGASSSKSSTSQISESENGSADSDEDSNDMKEGGSEVSSSSSKAQHNKIKSSTPNQDHSNNNEAAKASESDLICKKHKLVNSGRIKDTVDTPDSSGDAKTDKVDKTEDKSSDKTVKGGDDSEVKQEVNGEIGDESSKTTKNAEGASSSPTPRENGEVMQGEGKGKAKNTSSNVEEKRNIPILRSRQAADLYRALLRNHENMDSDSDDDDDDEGDESFQGVDNSSDDDDEAEGDEDENEEVEGEDGDEDENEEDEDGDDEDDGEDDEEEDDGGGAPEMTDRPGLDSGCTAVVALLKGQELYVANAGDSRCVVCRNGEAIEMSLDHKPEDDVEKTRIVKAGGRVNFDGRVNGGLNLSRALGDHAYKQSEELSAQEQMITALPDVRTLMIDPKEDEFMILACDGIWNSLSSQEVVEFIRERIKKGDKVLSKICEELFDHCLAPDCLGDGTGCDNMTAVIVKFKPELGNATEKRAHSPTSETDSQSAKHPKIEETEVASV